MGRISVPWLRQSARPRRARRATLTSITGYLLWSGPRGVGAPLGQLHFRRPYLRSAPWGRKSAGTKGAQGWGPQKPPVLVVVAGSRVFGVPLRGRLPVLRCLPLCALPYRSIARVGNPITVTLSASIVRASWMAGRARDGFCRFPTQSIQGVRTGALGRSAVRPGGLCPASESLAWSHAAGIVEAGSCK